MYTHEVCDKFSIVTIPQSAAHRIKLSFSIKSIFSELTIEYMYLLKQWSTVCFQIQELRAEMDATVTNVHFFSDISASTSDLQLKMPQNETQEIRK